MSAQLSMASRGSEWGQIVELTGLDNVLPPAWLPTRRRGH
jgi:hypothetical protein